MSTTGMDLANPLLELRDGLQAALEAEENRFAAVVAGLTAQHEIITGRLKAAIASLDGDEPTNGSSNGHSEIDMAALVEPELPVPEVGPGDELVDLTGMTMEQAVLTIMSTRPGHVWKVAQLRPILHNAGLSDKASSIAACLSLAFRSGKLKKADPGEYIHP